MGTTEQTRDPRLRLFEVTSRSKVDTWLETLEKDEDEAKITKPYIKTGQANTRSTTATRDKGLPEDYPIKHGSNTCFQSTKGSADNRDKQSNAASQKSTPRPKKPERKPPGSKSVQHDIEYIFSSISEELDRKESMIRERRMSKSGKVSLAKSVKLKHKLEHIIYRTDSDLLRERWDDSDTSTDTDNSSNFSADTNDSDTDIDLDDTELHREVLAAKPELTRILSSPSVSRKLKYCISGAVSNLLEDKWRKDSAIFKSKRRTIELDLDGTSDYHKAKMDFYEYYNVRKIKPGRHKPTDDNYIFDADTENERFEDEKYQLNYIPTWFIGLLMNGGITVDLLPTFPTDIEDTSDQQVYDEYTELANANISISLSLCNFIVNVSKKEECRLNVMEHLSFPLLVHLAPNPGSHLDIPAERLTSSLPINVSTSGLPLKHSTSGMIVNRSATSVAVSIAHCDLESLWRKPYTYSASLCELCRKRRISFTGLYRENTLKHITGLFDGSENTKHFRIVFMKPDNRRCVLGIYRRQLTSCNKFLTWKFKIKY